MLNWFKHTYQMTVATYSLELLEDMSSQSINRA